MNIKNLKDYLDKEKILIDKIDFGGDDIKDIQANPVLLAEFYIKCFNEFRRCFILFDETKDFIEKHHPIFIEVLKLSLYKHSDSEFGKSRKIKLLENFILSKYSEITDFINYYLEVTDELSDLQQNLLG